MKLESVIGVGLLLLAVIGFLLSVILGLPNREEVNANAQPLPEIPRDLFSSDNELTNSVRALTKPSGVPVVVDPSTVGRSNVFESF
jgi:hypothetical protein